MMPTTLLHESRSLATWQAEHLALGGELFPTLASLQWFIRQNRTELETQKAIIPGKGSRGTMLTPNFDRITISLLISAKENVGGTSNAS